MAVYQDVTECASLLARQWTLLHQSCRLGFALALGTSASACTSTCRSRSRRRRYCLLLATVLLGHDDSKAVAVCWDSGSSGGR